MKNAFKKYISLTNKIFAFIKSTKCITGYYIYERGAATQSLLSYMQIKNSKSNLYPTVALIEIRMRFYYSKLVLSLLSNKVIVNQCIYNSPWHILIFLLLKPNAIVYTHNGQYQYEHDERQKYSTRLKKYIVNLILNRHKILCVSKIQEAYIQNRFKNKNTKVIYNCIACVPDCLRLIDNQPKSKSNIRIIMLGSLIPRKGASFYGELADYAKAKGQKWEFYWVGKKGGEEKRYSLYVSNNVRYINFTLQTYFALDKCDIFFLSSIDDPFPLVALESLSQYKKVVAYKNVGTAELIEHINGCEIYQKYNVKEAYSAIQKVIQEPLDMQKVKDINENFSSIEGFSKRLDKVLEGHWGSA